MGTPLERYGTTGGFSLAYILASVLAVLRQVIGRSCPFGDR